MKKRTTALLAGVLAAALLLLPSCGQSPASSSASFSSEPSSNPEDDVVIGNDWRAIRGYSNEVYDFFGTESLISLHSGDNYLKYAFYDSSDGGYLGEIVLDSSRWTVDDMDQDLLWTLYEEDFNLDGVNEYGVPMQDGLVLWYEYVHGTGFVLFGEGDAEGPYEPFPMRVGAGVSDIYSLDENGFDVCFTYFEDEVHAGYYVMDTYNEYCYGVLAVDAGPEFADQVLDRSTEDCFQFEDLDGDGVMEIGLPLTSGSVLWYHYDDELEDFELYSEEVSAPEEEDAFTILMDALGDKMQGKALVAYGIDMVNGTSCQTFALGTNTPEKFTAEEHFAVDADGNIYVCDIANGFDYVPYQP